MLATRLILISFMLIFCVAVGYTQDWMPDLALREAIGESIELPAGVLLEKRHLEWIEFLGLHNKGITDLTGLEFAMNLRELHISKNPITDLSPLVDLMKLEELHFWHSTPPSLTGLDLSPLAKLTNLRVLSLSTNRITDISPLANLDSLIHLHIEGNHITDFSSLAGLTNLQTLDIRWNPGRDFSPLSGLNLMDFRYDEICEVPGIPTADRVENRTFPSIALPGSSLVDSRTRVRWLQHGDPDTYYEEATKHDLHHYAHMFGLSWHLTPTEPAYGLSTRLYANSGFEVVMSEYEEYIRRNPNMLFLPEIRLHNHLDSDAFPSDSEFWMRGTDGQILKNDVPWDEYTIDILNPEVQQLLIKRVVGIAECGLFDGVLFDAFVPYHVYVYNEFLNIATEEEVIAAYITILKGIRTRVREDFLILVNRNEKKSPRYAEWINGSFMEINPEHSGGFTYKKLNEVEDALLWNEAHLREPRINVLQGEGIAEPIDGPNNSRWMRVFTTMSLTHSDGYCIFRVPKEFDGYTQGVHIFYDFWNAPLGRPIGEKGQRYENQEGVFIREFTNGWAVYNRSGKAQDIQLPEVVNGWASSVKNERWHTLPDLDGEIYLKNTASPADVNGDGTVNILDLVAVANAFGEEAPDVNGDGIVNILDLVTIANAF